MYNDYFAPMSYYERSDYEEPAETLSESKLETVREFFEELLDMIYSKKPIAREQIDFCVDELCAALKMTRPEGQLAI